MAKEKKDTRNFIVATEAVEREAYGLVLFARNLAVFIAEGNDAKRRACKRTLEGDIDVLRNNLLVFEKELKEL